MIYDYPSKTFIEDGCRDRLLIRGFAFIQQKPVSFRLAREGDGPMEDDATVYRDIAFIFENGVLKLYADGKRLIGIENFMFVMSSSEVSSSLEQQYKKNQSQEFESIYPNVLEPNVKQAIQVGIQKLAEQNGIVTPEGVKFFNDQLILFTSPFLRTISNSSTNFYKIMEDLRERSVGNVERKNYLINHLLLESTSLSEAVKNYLGTNSKELTKFIAGRLVKKTDLVKSLSPKLLEILTNQSGNIFKTVSEGLNTSEVKILTCYEDIMLDVFGYVKFIMDVFSGNIDHTQNFLNNGNVCDNYYTDVEKAQFLKENFSPKKITAILNDTGNYRSYLNDIVRQYNEYKDSKSIPVRLRHEYPDGLTMPKNWKTLKELHDKVSADYNKIKAEDNNKPIEYSPQEFQLHGLVDENVELMLPSEGATLVAWGKEQSHCVASYADRAARKELVIMGVKVDGIHKYTLELRFHKNYVPTITKEQIAQTNENGMLEGSAQWENKEEISCEIYQFRGERNSNPDSEHREKVEKLIYSVFKPYASSRYSSDALDAMRYANVNLNVNGHAIIQNVAAE